MSRHLWHVTLTTGHGRESPRSEVLERTVTMLAPVVERALAGERVADPLPPGYTLTGTDYGPCAQFVVEAESEDGPEPILTLGVATHSRCGAGMWRALHEGRAELATDPEHSPGLPWLADRIEPGMALHPDAASWTGDLSRSLAWAFVEIQEGRP